MGIKSQRLAENWPTRHWGRLPAPSDIAVNG